MNSHQTPYSNQPKPYMDPNPPPHRRRSYRKNPNRRTVRRPIPTNAMELYRPTEARETLMTRHVWPKHLTRNDPDVYFVKLEPRDEVGRLPSAFSRKHFFTVKTRVTLTDPNGNVTYMKVLLKRKGFVFLTDAWKFLGRFYGLFLGGWIRLAYQESVANWEGKEVEYPPSPEPLEPIEPIEKRKSKMVVDFSGVSHYFSKWLTPDAINGNCMTICKEFFFEALPLTDSGVCVIDDEGNG